MNLTEALTVSLNTPKVILGDQMLVDNYWNIYTDMSRKPTNHHPNKPINQPITQTELNGFRKRRDQLYDLNLPRMKDPHNRMTSYNDSAYTVNRRHIDSQKNMKLCKYIFAHYADHTTFRSSNMYTLFALVVSDILTLIIRNRRD